MPDAGGNIKGIAITGKAGETVARIFGSRDCGQIPETCKWGDACADCRPPDMCGWHPDVEATRTVCGEHMCEDCFEKAMGLD